MKERKVKGYYTTDEAAELLGYSQSYIIKLIDDKKLAAMKEPTGGQGNFRYLIPEFDVDRALDAKHGALESAALAQTNKYVTPDTLAEATGIPYKTISNAIKEGKLSSSRIHFDGSKGSRKVVQIADAKKFVKKFWDAQPKLLTADELREVLK